MEKYSKQLEKDLVKGKYGDQEVTEFTRQIVWRNPKLLLKIHDVGGLGEIELTFTWVARSRLRLGDDVVSKSVQNAGG